MTAPHQENQEKGEIVSSVFSTLSVFVPTAPAKNALFVDRLTLSLGKRIILSDVSFAIQQGEFIGVLGPNGAGKTTLMRAILGLIKPVSGTVQIGAAAPGGAVPGVAIKRVGYLPQTKHTTALSGLRVWDFLASSIRGEAWGLPRLSQQSKQEITNVLEEVEAQSLAQRPLYALSGGERQRILLAQALLDAPQILLLDEPLAGLDPYHQQTVIKLICRLQQKFNMTVLFCSHELNPLLGAMHRVLYLGGGQAALGTVDEVITGPVLSQLYGFPIEVLKTGKRIFVMSSEFEIERDEHRHGSC